MNHANLTRSMSRKQACSPDNADCEGFFGRLKNELFYPRDWKGTTIEQFTKVVDSCIHWCNQKRINTSSGSLCPIECRVSLGLATYNQSKFLSAPRRTGSNFPGQRSNRDRRDVLDLSQRKT